MRMTWRTSLVLVVVLLLVVFVLPAFAETTQTESGTTVINGDVLAPATTTNETVKFVEATYGPEPALPTTFGGKRNTPD